MMQTFVSVLPIFFIIVTGYILKSIMIREVHFWSIAEKLTYYLLLPCLLILDISSAQGNFEDAMGAITATVSATLLVGLIALISKYLFKIDGALFTSIFQGSTRYNSYVFLGMAVALYGSKGTAIMGIFAIYMIILTNLLSIVVMNSYGVGEKKGISTVLKKIASNPLIISALVGYAFQHFQIQIPSVIKNFMHILSAAASPLSLMAVGAGLQFGWSRPKAIAIIYSSMLKLVVMPVLTLIILRILSVKGEHAGMAVLYASLPCAGNAFILAKQMGGDADAMASIITLTILGSVLTISLSSCLVF